MLPKAVRRTAVRSPEEKIAFSPTAESFRATPRREPWEGAVSNRKRSVDIEFARRRTHPLERIEDEAISRDVGRQRLGADGSPNSSYRWPFSSAWANGSYASYLTGSGPERAGRIMEAEKTLRFQGKNLNIAQLKREIEGTPRSHGHKTQSATMASGRLVQALKGVIRSDIMAAKQAFTILLTGPPDDFSIRVGVGKLVPNLAVRAAESPLLSGLSLGPDIPDMLWTRHLEKGPVDGIRVPVG